MGHLLLRPHMELSTTNLGALIRKSYAKLSVATPHGNSTCASAAVPGYSYTHPLSISSCTSSRVSSMLSSAELQLLKWMDKGVSSLAGLSIEGKCLMGMSLRKPVLTPSEMSSSPIVWLMDGKIRKCIG